MVLKAWFNRKLEESRVYPESWLNRWDAGPTHPYWLARVGEAAARAFRLGYDSERNEVTYPLRDSGGRVLGVVRRNLDGGDGPKYRYPIGIDVGRLLFGYERSSRRVVVLCEGALDCIALWNIGVQAFAIYGSRLSEEQIKLVDRIDPDTVVCAFDNDDAGFHAYLQVKRGMKHRQVERVAWPLSWGKDVDELSEERRRKIFAVVLASYDPPCIESSTWRSKTSERQSGSPLLTTSKRSKMQIVRTKR